jgi:hypothetical protein
MQPPGRLLEEVRLENGLSIFFYDCSRPVIGDRYHVELLVSVPLEVRADYFKDIDDPLKAHEAFTATHGSVVAFDQKKIRNFVAKDEVPALLRHLQDEFLLSSRAYLLKEGFAAKFVRKQFREWKERQQLQAKMEAAFEAAPPEQDL